MNKDKKDKQKKHSKAKIILRLIFNWFCYVFTAIGIFVLILICINGCSNQSQSSVSTKRNNRVVNDAPITLMFNGLIFNYSQQYQTQTPAITFSGANHQLFFIDLENVDDFKFQVVSSGGSFVCDIYTGSEYFPANTGHYTDLTSFYTENHVLKTTWTRTGVPAPTYSSSSLVNGHKFILLGFTYTGPGLVLNSFPYSSVNNFYRYFTYLGYTDSQLNTYTHSQLEDIYNYFVYNRYENYFDSQGKKFIVNPTYDFTNVNFVANMNIYDCDSDRLAIDEYSEQINTRNLRYDSESQSMCAYNSFIAGQYTNGLSRQLSYFVSRYGQNRFLDDFDYGKADKNVDPWRYYYRINIYQFDELIPYQDGNVFTELFFALDDYGCLEATGQFNFKLYGIYNCYIEHIFYSGTSARDVRNWFNNDSDLYYYDSPWKSFTCYTNYASPLQPLVGTSWVSGFSYYPTSIYYNSSALYDVYFNDSEAMALDRICEFRRINVSDYLFFINSGAKDFVLQTSWSPIDYGGVDNPTSIMTGVFTVFDLFRLSFDGIGGLLAIEISPGLPIGLLFFVPLAMTLLFTMLWIFKR